MTKIYGQDILIIRQGMSRDQEILETSRDQTLKDLENTTVKTRCIFRTLPNINDGTFR